MLDIVYACRCVDKRKRTVRDARRKERRHDRTLLCLMAECQKRTDEEGKPDRRHACFVESHDLFRKDRFRYLRHCRRHRDNVQLRGSVRSFSHAGRDDFIDTVPRCDARNDSCGGLVSQKDAPARDQALVVVLERACEKLEGVGALRPGPSAPCAGRGDPDLE